MLMKKIHFFFSVMVLLALSVSAFAQNVTVKGTVKDSNGDAIPGATVLLQGSTTVGTATMTDGSYALSVPSNGTLVFTSVGYKDVAVAVNGKTTINVVLEDDVEVLEQAIAVGYGSAKKISSIVGSVSTVNSETVKNAPSSSALDQLQGQVAGLSVLSYSGIAGDNAVSMTLHGVGSLEAGTAPLYVIDGIPSSSTAVMNMNPNDIESVSVLKDASATSIYGARAANGVVYISTKTGSYSSNATVTYRGQYGVSTLADTSLYESMMTSDELMDFWVRAGIHTQDWINKTYLDKGYNYNTPWYKYMMDLWNPQYQNDLTIEGGGSKVAYMIAASQYHQKGYSPGNFFDRYTLRSNVQAHPTNWLKTGINLNLSMSSTQQNPNWGSAANGMSNYTGGGLSFLLIPMYPAVDEEGNVYEKKFPGQNRITPHYYMDNHIDQYDRYGVNGNLFVEIEPIRNLKFVSRGGVDGYIRLRNLETTPSYVAANGGTATVGHSSTFEYSANITNTAEYSFQITEDHKISLLAGHEGVQNYYKTFSAQSSGQTDDRLVRLNDGTADSRSVSESYTESRFLSFFGHADYTLMDRYILDATIRNDASSRFGPDVRNATFWSVGGMWNIKKEKFMRNARAVNDLRLKVSYGTQGNAAIGDYSHLGLVGTTSKYADASGIHVSQPSNTHLTWEKQGLFTVTLTGRLFNKLDFDLEYYNRKTSSMILDVPQPYTAGITEATSNVGSLMNQGVDITLGFDFLRGRDYWLRASTTFNYNAQKVTELFDGKHTWPMYSYMIAYVVGSPVMFYNPIYAGIDPEDGMPMWYLPGEDPDVCTMDPNRTTKVFDEEGLTQNTGKKRYAPINGGFSLSGGWKGLSVQADFSYVLGKYLVSNDGYFYGNPANFSTMNTNKAVSDFWTPDHRDAKWPDWSKGAVMQFDTHLLEDASFLRLKNLQVAYSLPKKALGWQKAVKEFKITFTGRNLLTFTKYTGIDPEINSNLTYGVGGNSKQFLGGIEIKF